MRTSADPLLKTLKPGDLVGVELECPRYDCDWAEPYGSAEVVNAYGVKDPIPRWCKRHGLAVDVTKIVKGFPRHED